MSMSELGLLAVALKATSLVLFILIGTYGSARVLYTILVVDVIRPVLNLCVANLSSADLLVCTVLLPLTIASLVSGHFILGHTMCVLHNTLVVYLGQVAALSITAIVYERYRSISGWLFPSLSPLQITLLLSATWILPIPFVFPKFRQHLIYFPKTGMCFNTYTAQSQAWNILFITNAAINCMCGLFIVFWFWKIFGTLRRLRVSARGGYLTDKETLSVSARAHSAWTSMYFVLIHAVMALPVYIALAVDQYSIYFGKSGIPNTVRCLALWAYWFQFTVKPIIFTWRRGRYIGIILCFCRRKQAVQLPKKVVRRSGDRSLDMEIKLSQPSGSREANKSPRATPEDINEKPLRLAILLEEFRVSLEDARPQTVLSHLCTRDSPPIGSASRNTIIHVSDATRDKQPTSCLQNACPNPCCIESTQRMSIEASKSDFPKWAGKAVNNGHKEQDNCSVSSEEDKNT